MPFSSLNLSLLSGSKEKQDKGGKTDLLLRFFDSQFFDEWICITYLYKSNQQGIQDYLCNRLYDLPEQGVERYLSQLTQLLVQRQNPLLDKVVVDLCARSLRIAVKTYWLLLAISQDQLKNKHVADVRDRCEQAALEGYWEPPFRDTKLVPHAPSARSLHGPLSPTVVSPPRSPGPRDGGSSRSLQRQIEELTAMTSSSVPVPGSSHSAVQEALLREQFGSPEPRRDADGTAVLRGRFGFPPEPPGVLSPGSGARSPPPHGMMSPPPPGVLSPGGLDRAMYDCEAVGQHLEQLAFYRAPTSAGGSTAGSPRGSDARPLSPVQRERHGKLHIELGEGEGVTALLEKSYTANGLVTMHEEDEQGLLSPTNSPRLRQTTFGATLDFVEALCTASSGLTSFAHEDRQWALCRALDAINKEIETAARNGVAIWFPMGRRTDRVVRLVSNEVTILNSREKAPFLLFVEVINSDEDEDRTTEGALSPERMMSPNASFVMHPLDTPPPEAAAAAGLPSSSSAARPAPPPAEDSFTQGLRSALAGLRGEGPLVHVQLEALQPWPAEGDPTSPLTSSRADSEGEGGEGGRTLGLLSRWALRSSLSGGVRRTDTEGEGASNPSAGASPKDPPLVRLRLQVVGGMDLRIRSTSAKHRRVPSHEALLKMAMQHKTSISHQALAGSSAGGGIPEGPITPLMPPEAEGNQPTRPEPEAAAAEAAGPPTEPRGRARVRRGAGPKLDPSALGSGAHNVEQVRQQLVARQLEVATASQDERAQQNEQERAQRRAANAAYGERFSVRRNRLRRASVYGKHPGWDMRAVIVKTGDDCRQELLAVQMVQAFADVFAEAGLPLWLRPFEVLVTSNRTALIQVISNCVSIHQLKARTGCTSLREHFCDKYMEGSPEFHKAQRNFVESMAAYSIVCYLLQIKDRHNGNIMMDDVGHVVHIDFGFMLSNSPGGVNFENAPFKLTRELLEVMDSNSEGKASELFDYFKVLMIQGFLVCRKHADRILLLVEMMANSGCPCFKAGPRAVQALRKRFHLNLTDAQCVEMVLGLISESLDAWRTRQYDYYQRVLNGIL